MSDPATPSHGTGQPSSIEALVPHRWPMRLVEAVIERGDGWIRCSGRVPADSPLASGGRAPAVLAIELAAQGAAVLEALLRGEGEAAEGGPRLGYLVSLQDVRLEQPTIPAGEPLLAEVRQTGGAAALARYEAIVTSQDGSQVFAAGTFGTFALPAGG